MIGKIFAIIGIIVGIVCLVVGLGALEAWIVMSLWNWAVVGTFMSAPILTFGKTWAILIIINIIGSAFKVVIGTSKN